MLSFLSSLSRPLRSDLQTSIKLPMLSNTIQLQMRHYLFCGFTPCICFCFFHILILTPIKHNFCFDFDSHWGQIQEISTCMLTFITKTVQKSKLIFITKIIQHTMAVKLSTSTNFLQIKAFMHSSEKMCKTSYKSTCALMDLH